MLSHRDSSFWFVESTIYEVRHLIFAWYFARHHEYIILFSKLLPEIGGIIPI